MANPIEHALITSGLGVVFWLRTRKPKAAAAFIAAGVLLDADHLLDHALGKATRRRGWYTLFLHSWELLAALGVGSMLPGKRATVASIGLGILSHMVIDQLANYMPGRWFYSVAFRARRGFRGERLGLARKDQVWMDGPWWSWLLHGGKCLRQEEK